MPYKNRPLVGPPLFLVLALSLALSGFGFFRLWHDYRDFDGDADGRESFGKVSDRANTTQRKSPQAFSWDSLNGGETVYFGDTLQTGPSSRLVVTDLKGRKVELEENSLVMVEKNADLSLRFEQGRFFVFEEGKGTATSIEAQHGQVKRQVLGFRVEEPHRFDFALVGNESQVKVKVAVALTSDTATPQLFTRSGDNDSSEQKTEQKAELHASAKNPDHLDGEISLSEGRHRLIWKDGDHNVKTDLVRVWRAQPLEKIAPRNNEIAFGTGAGKTRVDFEWSNPNATARGVWAATSSRIEVNNVRQGTSQNFDVADNATQIAVSLDSGATYAWRLVTRLADGRELASSKSNFRIEAAPALKALYPAAEGEKFLDWEKGPAVTFKYRIHESVTADTALAIEFSNRADFSQIEVSHKLEPRSTFVQMPAGFLANGSHFWRLTAKARGSDSFATEARSFEYGLVAPPEAPVFTTANNRRFVRGQDKQITLELQAAERASSYTFTVIPVAIERGIRRLAEVDNAKSIEKGVTPPRLEIGELPPGTYRAIARAVDRRDRKSPPSKEIQFTVDWGQALSAPKIKTKEAQ